MELTERMERATHTLGPVAPKTVSIASRARDVLGILTIGGPCFEIPFIPSEWEEPGGKGAYRRQMAVMKSAIYQAAKQIRNLTGEPYSIRWLEDGGNVSPVDWVTIAPRPTDGATAWTRVWKVAPQRAGKVYHPPQAAQTPQTPEPPRQRNPACIAPNNPNHPDQIAKRGTV